MSMFLHTPMQNRRDVAQPARIGENLFVHSRTGCKVIGAAPAFIPAVRKSHLFRTPSKSGQRVDYSAPLLVFSDSLGGGAGFEPRAARLPFQTHKTAAGLSMTGGFICDISPNQRDL